MTIEIAAGLGIFLTLFYLIYFMWMFRLSERSRNVSSLEHHYSPSVSIVVCTYNEEATIKRKLSNLLEQDYPSKEIVVVDGASEDKTVKLIEEFVKDNNLKLKLIKEEARKGKASALNEAVEHCSSEIVVATDADSIWDKSTLSKAVSNFADPKVGAVTGRQILLNQNQNIATKSERIYGSFYEILRAGESAMDSTPIFRGEITCFRKNLFEKIEWDSMADDSEMAVRIRKKGFRSISDHSVLFYEYAPPSFKSRFIQKVRRGQGLIQLFWRHREILFNQNYGKFGTGIFPANFFMFVISPILVFIFMILFLLSFFSINTFTFAGFGIAFLTLLAGATILKINIAILALSFLTSQLTLLVSLVWHIAGKSQYMWKKTEEIRDLWSNN